MEIIRCEQLSKIYESGTNRIYALDKVNLAIEQGSFTAITGPSGSGKSTLLHLMSGLDKPTQGAVIYQGKNRAIIGTTSCPSCGGGASGLCSRAITWCGN